jgi:sortase A
VEEVGWTYVVQDGREVPMWDVPDEAAGFHKTSAYPGRPGNTVLNGHRDIGGSVFLHLDRLQPGDLITLYVGQVAYAYHVVEIVIFQERDASAEERQANRRWIKPFPDERLTLVTCWPLGSNSHRLLVIAKPPATP